MKVLIACEESQAVCKAFRARGFEAYSCDIQECSGGRPEWHILGDVLEIINPFIAFDWNESIEFETMDGKEHWIDGPWDLIIAHPPCTYLSNAGACRLYPRKGEINQARYELGLKAKEFFMKLYQAKCKHIAIENPVPSKVFDLPLHSQEIQPFQFGHPYTKKTRLWLVNLPLLKPTNIVQPIGPFVPSGTGRKDKSKYGAAKRGEDAKNRAKTFPGIAEAMASQWGDYLKGR